MPTVRVLGSAAAEGFPALFCTCPICAKARENGGKDIRRRTTYIVGQSVMVDFGPDAYHSMIAFGLDYAPLHHLLISHSHQDHWFPEELYYRRKGFSVVAEGSTLTIHGNEQVAEKLFEALEAVSYTHLMLPTKA